MKRLNIMISAGEASGDLHASKLVVQLRQLYSELDIWGMGGARLAAAGSELLVSNQALGFIGYVDVILHYPAILRELNRLQQALADRRPDLVILVDYPGFNLRLAKTAKSLGIPVLYYISPQIWAWKPERIDQIAACVDYMAVLFPFEVPIYQAAGVPVRLVGHPLVDEAKPSLSRAAASKAFGLTPGLPTLGLLPGSRIGEIKRILPIMLQSLRLLRQRHGELNLLLPVADSLDPRLLAAAVNDSGVPVRVIPGQAYEVMHLADAVLCSSGTATLETAIIGTPMVIIYKLNWLNYWIMRRLITLEHIGLVNIVAGKRIVQEFIQNAARPAAIADEVSRILRDAAYRNDLRQQLAAIKPLLGAGGGSKQVAELALEMLKVPLAHHTPSAG